MISVLIPVYRVPLPWFNEALQSVDSALDNLEATCGGSGASRPEIVLINDGSDQPDLLEFLAQRSQEPRTRVIPCAQNLGVAGALNFGLQHCRYDLVARFDADDIMMRGRLAAQYAAMRDDPQIDCLGTNMNLLCETAEGWAIDPRSTSFPEVVTREIAKTSLLLVHHPTVMYRKSSVLRAGGYDESLKGFSEDYELWVRMLLHNMTLRNLPNSYHLLRRHAGSASNAFNPANDDFLRQTLARLQ